MQEINSIMCVCDWIIYDYLQLSPIENKIKCVHFVLHTHTMASSANWGTYDVKVYIFPNKPEFYEGLEIQCLDDIRSHFNFTRVWELHEDGSLGKELNRNTRGAQLPMRVVCEKLES